MERAWTDCECLFRDGFLRKLCLCESPESSLRTRFEKRAFPSFHDDTCPRRHFCANLRHDWNSFSIRDKEKQRSGKKWNVRLSGVHVTCCVNCGLVNSAVQFETGKTVNKEFVWAKDFLVLAVGPLWHAKVSIGTIPNALCRMWCDCFALATHLWFIDTHSHTHPEHLNHKSATHTTKFMWIIDGQLFEKWLSIQKVRHFWGPEFPCECPCCLSIGAFSNGKNGNARVNLVKISFSCWQTSHNVVEK